MSKKLSSEEVNKIKIMFPAIPEDYFDFMRNIGWGNFSNSLMLYSAPVNPDEIYGDDYPDDISRILIFGDDFNGRCFGWDPSNKFYIGEIDPILPSRSKSIERGTITK
ncbi:hypothetical protein [Chamaesiphon polymorphus]|uniref:Knr4/Smi1-like domain-containing protein n=1 Tax=Chamaesiphon polymorphus CCALA 037 TaxID=2107692 RepID=A0A2T1F5B9_9CYAN|nr:hypothetical protein [Chamaesiphon polymorphus]PSB40118.1 hypothetical protein C7B77_28795 [Chamaesiphon polymorphus CCALA 037]